VLVILLLLVVAHRYTLGLGSLAYALSGVTTWSWLRLRRRRPAEEPAAALVDPAPPVPPAGGAQPTP